MTGLPAEARIALAMAGLAVITLPVERHRVHRYEMRVFRAVNDLPEWVFRPAWVVMQLGALGAAPASAGVAYAMGKPRLAARLVLAGSTTWVAAKGIKRIVRRGRPMSILTAVHSRGRVATGHGYLSGHAAVAAALAASVAPELEGGARRAVVVAAAVVGLSRIYVGAHLPLDVAGGVALGLLVDGALRLGEGLDR